MPYRSARLSVRGPKISGYSFKMHLLGGEFLSFERTEVCSRILSAIQWARPSAYHRRRAHGRWSRLIQETSGYWPTKTGFSLLQRKGTSLRIESPVRWNRRSNSVDRMDALRRLWLPTQSTGGFSYQT